MPSRPYLALSYFTLERLHNRVGEPMQIEKLKYYMSISFHPEVCDRPDQIFKLGLHL
jgi:hypothetical protein